jgi:hypothetical protein
MNRGGRPDSVKRGFTYAAVMDSGIPLPSDVVFSYAESLVHCGIDSLLPTAAEWPVHDPACVCDLSCDLVDRGNVSTRSWTAD